MAHSSSMLRPKNLTRLCSLSLALLISDVDAAEFSSRYTYLAKECRWLFAAKDLQEGQDNSLVCKGPGEYELVIDFAADDTVLSVRRHSGSKVEIVAAAVSGIDDRRGVVEWRMVDGKPFAIIVRARAMLEVRGLDERQTIHASIDVKQVKSANRKAREYADANYVR